ncbi:MAG: hypothetical protein ACSLE1_10840 [Sphingobium sp.]
MTRHSLSVVLAAIGIAAASPAAAKGVVLTNTVMAQQRATAADGSTSIALVPVSRVVPGDRVVFRIAYRNEGSIPAGNLTLDNPIPDALAYRGPASDSAAPELSVDGRNFGPLATLKVRGSDGALRPAQSGDVTHVRWKLASPIAPGASGRVAFEAVVR